jgi:putative N6-adenine-specific DNA methylase
MVVYFAACTLGLEEVLAQELQAIGAGAVEVRRGGVAFQGDRVTGMQACLWLRSAVRVQEELIRGTVRDRDDLYRLASSVDWRHSITHLQTLAVDSSARDSFANDTRFPSLVVKDAIVDQFRERGGRRPDVDRDNPDLPLKIVLQGTEARLYRDLSGAPLHKRGYRELAHKAPLNEATAAGLLLLTEWRGDGPLCDPMCGSGTFLIEAALLATDRAPGLRRPFAFERWRDCDVVGWRQLKEEAEHRARAGAERALQLCGNDRHPNAIALAKTAAHAAAVRGIEFANLEVRDYVPPQPPAVVVTNPPYGERLDDPDLETSWRDLGTFLHSQCRGATAYVLCGNPELTRHLGLRTDRKMPVHNGPIECRWLRYAIDREQRSEAPAAAAEPE